jgi:type IV pilus assembly protein PilB
MSVPVSELKGRRLGRVLTKMGKVSRDQVHEALEIQKTKKERIGQLLIGLGYVTEEDVLQARAGQAGLEFVHVKDMELDASTLEAIPAEAANTFQVIPIEHEPESKRLVIAMKDPDNFKAIDDLRLLMGFKVAAVVSPPEEIEEVLKSKYSTSGSSMADIYADLGDSETVAAVSGRGDSIDLASLEAAADDNKVIQLLNLVLLQAIRDKASDIHFEPFEDEFKMRYRIDGRIELAIGGSPIDLRVAVLPTMFGESVVMRVLDRSNVQLSLDRVGLRDDELETMRSIIRRPNGIVVVTGPTGSGKTTTLYAALQELNTPDTKILTAEDPVEYDIDGLIQCQVNLDQELTFARLLRSFLRQDPDTILVGEIRDLETAQIAIQASLTGHLVFTTLHTNDAPSSVLRLQDLGVENFLLTATVEAIVAQRLVRRVCVKCKEEYVPSEEQLMELQLRPDDVKGRTFFRGRGCDNCNRSGYKGRLAIFEIMRMDDTVRELIMEQGSTAVLRTEARRRGMRTLRESGLLAIYEGQTTIDEVVRETIAEE